VYPHKITQTKSWFKTTKIDSSSLYLSVFQTAFPTLSHTMTSILSPLAEPFHPFYSAVEVPNAIIYNDGIPCLSFQGSESEFLHYITDETIDEVFPPDAQEAAEIEAMEVFVEMMASLAYLEEREEDIRSMEHNGLKKRWEARRELVDRPHPAKHLVTPVIHNQPHREDMKDLVTFPQNPQDYRMHKSEIPRMGRLPKKNNKMPSATFLQKPIQQPRKHS
jgi:hypothetical protein